MTAPLRELLRISEEIPFKSKNTGTRHTQVKMYGSHSVTDMQTSIDLLAIQEKSLDRALFLCIFIREVRSSGVRASITIVHIRKFYKT